MIEFKTALILAPHTDDGELGCGGTIARLAEMGTSVHYAAFSICEQSVPKDLPPDILATEVRQATQALNVDPERLHVYRYPVRKFPEHRQAILEQLIVLRRSIEPALVLLPATDDVHQDHQVIAQEGIRAFKNTTILGYEFPWNTLTFASTALVVLEPWHLEAKIEAVKLYRSQRHRSYISEDVIRSLARVRGQQAGTMFAEAFQVLRWVIR